MVMKFEKLFERGYIKNLSLKNRMVMSPMGTFSENHDGFPSNAQIDYYRARARGGLGMVIIEAQYCTNKTDPWIDYITTADTDQQMKGWSYIVEAIHSEGSKACIQIGCGLGRNAFPFSDAQMVSASEVPSFYFPDRLCRAFTIEEIHELVGAFGRAAARAKVAEADAIEIHAHSGYIIDQFMTPAWNKRTDEYGGSFENRMRLVTEIYHAMREAVGDDFPILIRMAADHDFDGGRTLEESIEIVKYLKGLGIDAFDIDVGCYEHKQWICPSIYAGDSCMVDYAAKIKEACDVIVLCSGTHTPESAEQALKEGKIDFAMFGRQLIADPDTPNKLLNGQREDVRPCLSCNQICVGRLYQNRKIGCAINAIAVAEGEYVIKKTDNPLNVLVVGGGPAGLEAARVAALQGHHVTLYEKRNKLGGQFLIASIPSFKHRLKDFIDWEVLQCQKAGVVFKLNKTITPDSIELAEADRIILALGGIPFTPPIPGVEHSVEVCISHLLPDLVKGNKIVIAGGGLSGCDAALDLALEGRDVTIIEMQSELCPNSLIDNRNPLMFKLEENGVKQMTSTKILEIQPNGVKVSGPNGEEFIEADTVISAFGTKPNNSYVNAICDKYPTTQVVGDCVKPGQVSDAVRSGFFAAYSLH